MVVRTCCSCARTGTAAAATTAAVQPIGEQPIVGRGHGRRRIPPVDYHDRRGRRRRLGHRLKSVQRSAGDGGRGRGRRLRRRWSRHRRRRRWRRPVTVQPPTAPVPQGLAFASAVDANILFHSPRDFAVSRPPWPPWPASAAYGHAADHRVTASGVSDGRSNEQPCTWRAGYDCRKTPISCR